MPPTYKHWIVLLIACALCFGAGIVVSKLIGGDLSVGEHELRNAESYKYVSPLLACSEGETLLPKDVREAEAAVADIIDQHEANGTLTSAAVYFRDLRNGPWFGINEDATFVPGSLLKVPIMISYLKLLEERPEIATQPVLYERDQSDAVQNVSVAHPLIIGESYLPDMLLERMITESDNESTHLLYAVIGEAFIGKTFSDLGLAAPFMGKDYDIRVRDYATFFRVLYNATYLTPENAERALALLVRTDFDRGIAAGVPEGIPVANKFGERNYSGSSEYQLHDCGIVYAGDRPYTLCVITRGSNIDQLASIIQEISATVYRHIAE